MKADFDLSDVTWFLGLTDDARIDVWLDGGWGVDAGPRRIGGSSP